MLSVVIPTLNAAATLSATLERIAGADEIVVADGGSSDETGAIAGRHGARLILAAKGRGSQLSAGAASARGDWLLFLHADTLPGPRWREAVASHVREAQNKAAFFSLCLADPAWQARIVELGAAARIRLLGLPYGDQGLLIPSRLYDEIGGYRPLPLMEDVDIARRIGRKRLRELPERAFTSSERWRRDGWLRRSARNLGLLAFYRLGASPERLARHYG
jgi:rSAM/selenodomain-associated transferase 2